MKTEVEEKIILKMKHGSYAGLGCVDTSRRMREDDVGFGFTHDHPARVKTKDETYMDDSGFERVRHVYVDGEIVQLFPILEHEAAQADEMRAKDKRFAFSRKEAVKRAKQMIAAGVATVLSGSLE